MATEPDSAAVGLVGRKVLRFKFSEKMDRQNAESWLRLYPELEIQKTKWHGATEAEVILFDPLPADTVIVVEILPGMADSHRVKNNESRRFPLATGDSLFAGSVTGSLVMSDTALVGGVVELYSIPPDTMDYFQQQPLRRAVTDVTGTFRFEWLPTPGGPWLLRAFDDGDHNLRLGEKDAQRLLPDTLSIDLDRITASAGSTELYPWSHPGTLTTPPFDDLLQRAAIGAVALAVTDADTGWAPAPLDTAKQAYGWLDPLTGGVIEESPSHTVRVVVFADLDADSTFSAVPDSIYGPEAVALSDTVGWFLEPWGLVEGVELEPGLTAEFLVPTLGDSLVSWPAPIQAPIDTLATVLPDSLSELDPEETSE